MASDDVGETSQFENNWIQEVSYVWILGASCLGCITGERLRNVDSLLLLKDVFNASSVHISTRPKRTGMMFP
ncbi:nuclear pore complex subunit Nup192 [Aspergillus luchuensis]|uniref:Nuclear pore complex subunit Nup192 n=1 Tax=Aspergillus kawachii TaxID=1069201 RepID=A0A146FLJ8_ASPKA|nr:nuclear pore complex subunit Nup192 [Aspergillus luchuensis]